MGIDTGLDTDESRPVATGLPSLEREAGIEPASLAWKAKVLPLNYSRPILALALVEEAGFEPA
jgi:hypothetical protein